MRRSALIGRPLPSPFAADVFRWFPAAQREERRPPGASTRSCQPKEAPAVYRLRSNRTMRLAGPSGPKAFPIALARVHFEAYCLPEESIGPLLPGDRCCSAGPLSPCSHSHNPGILPSPNMFVSDGRLRSPSNRSVLCLARRASVHARFAATVLFPSCGTELVMSTLLSARVCCICRNRTARNRNFSAARLSLSVTQTSRL